MCTVESTWVANQTRIDMHKEEELRAELEQVKKALDLQKGLKQSLSDELYEQLVSPLKKKLTDLGNLLAGSGAIAQGNGATAAGAGGVAVHGDVHGDVIVHNRNAAATSVQDLRNAYLNRIMQTSGYLSLAGVDPALVGRRDAEARLSLNAVYTALLTLSRREIVHGKVHGQESLGQDERRLSALEQLNRGSRLVLQGDPGSGKSTFANFVALCLAGEAVGDHNINLQRLTEPLPGEDDDEQDEPQPQHWEQGALLPVLVVLRDFAATGLPEQGKSATAQHLWEFLEANLQQASLEDFAPHLKHELLERGGLILLDRLDEVPESEQRREQVKQAVEDFITVYHRCRYLVTSRTYAYQNQGWRLQGFDEAILAPLSDGQIRRFVERWYAHAAALGQLSSSDSAGRAELLKQAIFGQGRLRGLAQRPLLLTLMASLHAWRGGNLPEKRERLYADTVDLLLDFWEQRQVKRNEQGESILIQPSLVEWLNTDQEQVRKVLEELAYQAHASQPDLEGTADIPEGELVTQLLEVSTDKNIKPKLLIEYLRDRAGLLLPRGVGVYTFPHRSFQEYLAACYLTNHDFPEEMARLVRQDPDRWREVALLAGAKAARGSSSIAWQLAHELCFRDPGDDRSMEDVWGAQIAARILVETVDLAKLSDANRQRLDLVRRWLLSLMDDEVLPPIERAEAGQNLALLGDPRFDPQHWHLPDELLFGFVEIPAGRFVMGSDKQLDPDAWDEELEQHEVSLPTYYLARWPVTVAQFGSFLSDSGYLPADQNCREGGSNLPVNYVTWHDALAYCDWLQQQLKGLAAKRIAETAQLTGAELRFWQGLSAGALRVSLPSEAEWERAARGENGRIFPWGNQADPNCANYNESGIDDRSPVGCFPLGTSPLGCEEMSGNLWEWTRSRWEKYPYQSYEQQRREREGLSGDNRRVLRGGAFHDFPRYVRCAYRGYNDPDFRYGGVGFRVVVSPLPSLNDEASGL
jgi:formylglycine-generating enzyme required for sulfatase activity